MAFARGYKIVTDGLVGYFDTSNPISYSSGSLVWKDLMKNHDLILTGSETSPIYWENTSDPIPAIATFADNNVVYSNVFTENSAWIKDRSLKCTITGSAIAAPPGLPGSGSKLNEVAIQSEHGMQGSVESSINTPFRVSFYAKAAERSWIRYKNTDWNSFYIHFDLQNGVTGSKFLGPQNINGVPAGLYDPQIEDAGDGWWRCSFYIISAYDRFSLGLSTILDNSTISYVGDPTSGIYIYGVQVNYGETLTAYVDAPSTSSMANISSYLQYNGPTIQENNNYSVFVWAKGFGAAKNSYNIFSKYDNNTGDGIVFYADNSYIKYLNGTSYIVKNIFPIYGNSRPFTSYGWFQIGVVLGSNSIKFYWNGVNVHTASRATIATTNEPVRFGGYAGIGPSSIWNSYAGLGYGNVLIYDREITDQEAAQNFKALQTRFRLKSPNQQYGTKLV